MVIVDGDEDLSGADWLLVGVMELCHVWMLQSLLSSQSLVWVKLQKVLHEVEGIIASCWEHISQLLGLRWW